MMETTQPCKHCGKPAGRGYEYCSTACNLAANGLAKPTYAELEAALSARDAEVGRLKAELDTSRQLNDSFREKLATLRERCEKLEADAQVPGLVAKVLRARPGLELLIYDNDGENFGVRLIDENATGPKCINRRISFDLAFVLKAFLAALKEAPHAE